MTDHVDDRTEPDQMGQVYSGCPYIPSQTLNGFMQLLSRRARYWRRTARSEFATLQVNSNFHA